ncbi:MAG: hypothetical protein IPI30_21530 [Saprospiraceae bacterium]|nr:hypothetical protein [Candidatus Vicinibacter affinis]
MLVNWPGNGFRPLLNYSAHEDYGRRYGGNFLAPLITFGLPSGTLHGFQKLSSGILTTKCSGKFRLPHKNFSNEGLEIPHIYNTPEEENSIREFIRPLLKSKGG